jgi:uncharacterized membrane protein
MHLFLRMVLSTVVFYIYFVLKTTKEICVENVHILEVGYRYSCILFYLCCTFLRWNLFNCLIATIAIQSNTDSQSVLQTWDLQFDLCNLQELVPVYPHKSFVALLLYSGRVSKLCLFKAGD